MVTNFTPTLNFSPKVDSLPPENIDAEEAVLGCILLDPHAIYRIKDKLHPEHFYISIHRDIYQGFLKLLNNNKPVDLLTTIDYFKAKGNLEKIGGRNKLASLLDRTVSSVNIDHLADLVIEKYARRQVILLGNELLELGYQTGTELEEILQTIKNKTEWFTNCSYGKSEDEIDLYNYNRLLTQLKEIYFGISDPGLKMWKLQKLSRSYSKSVRDLEHIYQKSLCGKIGERLTLDQLEDSLDGSTREFLINGLLPKNTSVLVYADGGVGKTKFLYDLAYCMTTGQNWNGFPVTASDRKILIYQGDESKRDMLQALNKRGFKKGTDSRNHIETRFGWNFDAIPALVKDIEECKPDVIFIDSLTYANRYSIYDENRTEYARPVLELTAIAEEYGVTIVLIHHSSKGSGKPRGTTAIFNAVSEVYKLAKDTSFGATTQEKVLTIEKSRSRRFPASYKLSFDEEDFSLHLLEEMEESVNNSDSTTKDRIVEMLLSRRNTRLESEQLAHLIGSSSGNVRKCLNKLHRDGIINCDEISDSGTKKLYYIPFENRKCSIYNPSQNSTETSDPWINLSNPCVTEEKRNVADNNQCIKTPGSPPDHPPITYPDHLCISDIERDSSKGDPSVHEKPPNFSQSEKTPKKTDHRITFAEKWCQQSDSQGDPGVNTFENGKNHDSYNPDGERDLQGDRGNTKKGDPKDEITITSKTALQSNVVQNQSNNPALQPLEIKHSGNFGETVATATPIKLIRKGTCLVYRIEFVFPNGETTVVNRFKNDAGRKQLEEVIRAKTDIWELETMNNPNNRWKVEIIGGSEEDPEYIYIENCELIDIADLSVHRLWYYFKSPEGKIIPARDPSQFELMEE